MFHRESTKSIFVHAKKNLVFSLESLVKVFKRNHSSSSERALVSIEADTFSVFKTELYFGMFFFLYLESFEMIAERVLQSFDLS